MKCRSQPLSRILFPACALAGPDETTTIPLALQSLAGSSDLPGGLGRAALITPPYLVLLRAGFCLPSVLPRTRCALTAPFHPYLPLPPKGGSHISGMFSVPLSVKLPCPGVTRRTALRSSDFPPASAVGLGEAGSVRSLPTVARTKTGDCLAGCDHSIIAGLRARASGLRQASG